MDNRAVEFLNSAVELHYAASNLTPAITENQNLVKSSHIWEEPPYPHELKLVNAYVYLTEKRKNGYEVSEPDCDNVSTILTYIFRLSERQVKAEPTKDRKLDPSLMEQQSKDMLERQIKEIGKSEFTKQIRWEDKLMDILRLNMEILRKNGLLKIADIQELDSQIAFYIK